ncbi:recombinase family protein [Bariatricus sp. HCP28S3_E4]|uniref:recombinase family protein n=1 Tax=unclassified Bariatricus TaxID=2677046 RepID=UPI003F8C751A
MIYGYARVSSKEQNLDRQLAELRQAGVEERNIFTDKESGKTFNRKAYNLLVGTEKSASMLRKNDLLIVYSIDRLGRNYSEIMKQWKYITQEIQADIKVLDMPLLDTSKQDNSLDNRFVAELVLQILSYVAQKERENIKIRQAQGIKIAKEKGKHLGRPLAEFPLNWKEVYSEWKNKNITAVEAMKRMELKKNTFYNLVKRYENEKER